MPAPKNKTLKAFLDAKKKPSRVLGPVERHLLSQSPDYRDMTVLHPSDLARDDWCHRESYYLLTGSEYKRETPNLRLQGIFDEGHYIHAKWQRRFEEMGVLYGLWDNGPGTDQWWGLPDDGPAEGRRYREVPVRSSRMPLAGHGDGVLLGLGADLWLEAKSIGEGTIRKESTLMATYGDADEAWRNINRPFPTHLRQTLIYIEVWNEENPEFPIEEAVILYEWKANQAPKEFIVKRNPDLVAHIFGAIEDLMASVAAGEPPACNVDAENGCKKCRQYQ